jgi:fibronectin-binding autotransporter adhesin
MASGWFLGSLEPRLWTDDTYWYTNQAVTTRSGSYPNSLSETAGLWAGPYESPIVYLNGNKSVGTLYVGTQSVPNNNNSIVVLQGGTPNTWQSSRLDLGPGGIVMYGGGLEMGQGSSPPVTIGGNGDWRIAHTFYGGYQGIISLNDISNTATSTITVESGFVSVVGSILAGVGTTSLRVLSGTVRLFAANAYTGDTTVSGGFVEAIHPAALGADVATAKVSFSGTSTLRTQGSLTYLNKPFEVIAGAKLDLGGAATFNGGLTLSDVTVDNKTLAGTTLNSTAVQVSGTVTVNGLVLAANLKGPATSTLMLTDVTLTGNNSDYAGSIQHVGGTLSANSPYALGADNSTPWTVPADRTLVLGGASPITYANKALTVNGRLNLSNSAVNTFGGGILLANNSYIVGPDSSSGSGLATLKSSAYITVRSTVVYNVVLDGPLKGDTDSTLRVQTSRDTSIQMDDPRDGVVVLAGDNSEYLGYIYQANIKALTPTALGADVVKTLRVDGTYLSLGGDAAMTYQNLTLEFQNTWITTSRLDILDSTTKTFDKEIIIYQSPNSPRTAAKFSAFGVASKLVSSAIRAPPTVPYFTPSPNNPTIEISCATSGATTAAFEVAAPLHGPLNLDLSEATPSGTTANKPVVVLSGASNYTGSTKFLSGIAEARAPETATTGPFGKGSSMIFTGGDLRYSSVNNTDYSSRFVSNGSAQFWRIDTNGRDVRFASPLKGTGSYLRKMGAGTLTLAGANTFAGGTTVVEGAVELEATEVPGVSGPLGTGTVYVRGGILKHTASNTTDYSSRFDTAGLEQWDIDTNGQSVTYQAALRGAGSRFTKRGAGVLTLGGSNTYAAGTSILGGTLRAARTNSLGAGGVSMAAGSTLQITTSTGGRLSVAGTVTNAGGTLRIGGA